MRTTIDFQPDVEKAIQRRRRQTGKGLSETVNELLRESLVSRDQPRSSFAINAKAMGARIDVSNVAEALDILDEQ